MADQIVRFSKLLHIFKLNDKPAYIIELEENNHKKLYISHFKDNNLHYFELYDKTKLKKEFKDLSNHCLMNNCIDASFMFYDSPITHFEADCPNLINGHSMFSFSYLRSIKTEFPLLENGSCMFCETKIKEMDIDFPKLKNGYTMFSDSSLEKITSQFPLLENGQCMFENTQLKEINCKFSKLIHKEWMFDYTPPELKQNSPQYFI